MTASPPQDDDAHAVAGQGSDDRRPVLSQELMVRLRGYGSLETLAAGDLLYQPGDDRYDLIVIESGRVDLLCDAVPGVFAAGDVRLGSMKRVAAAMGEGAAAVASVHAKLALPDAG